MNNKTALIGLAVLAFLIALLLVVLIGKMLFGGRLRLPGGRARQARLGIVDAFDLDRQRQLIIIRRDNTEHLILIGGPNDLLIEPEILRVEARDARRDKESAFGDARIPAPLPPVERTEPPSGGALPDPMLPMPLPEMSPIPAQQGLPPSPPPMRPSTFPLPPRRPMPPPPAQGVESMLPSSVPRADDVRPSLPETQPVTPSAPADSMLGEPFVKPPVRPPFLKPLPPRPPLRPLRRTTPQVPPTFDAPSPILSPSGEPVSTAGLEPGPAPQPMAPPIGPRSQPEPMRPRPPEPSRPVPPVGRQAPPMATQNAPVQPPKPAPEPQTAPANSTEEPKDALESLEEEMAKLLGR